MSKYVCSACLEEFESDRSNEDAVEEMERLFGDVPPKDRTVVCHDCWLLIFPEEED